MHTGSNRRIAAGLVALALVGLTTGAAGPAPAPREGFSGNFDVINPETGEVISHFKALLRPSTSGRPVAGSQDAKGAPGFFITESHGQWARSDFWVDENHPEPGAGGSRVAFGEGFDCVYFGQPNDGVCAPTAVMYIDVIDPTRTDQVAFAQDRDATTGEWAFNIWLEVGSGHFAVKASN